MHEREREREITSTDIEMLLQTFTKLQGNVIFSAVNGPWIMQLFNRVEHEEGCTFQVITTLLLKERLSQPYVLSSLFPTRDCDRINLALTHTMVVTISNSNL